MEGCTCPVLTRVGERLVLRVLKVAIVPTKQPDLSLPDTGHATLRMSTASTLYMIALCIFVSLEQKEQVWLDG
jgi:hypothetical protein